MIVNAWKVVCLGFLSVGLFGAAPADLCLDVGMATLFPDEIGEIQAFVDASNLPVILVGGIVEGQRRYWGPDADFGKGEGRNSDLDYIVSEEDAQKFDGDRDALRDGRYGDFVLPMVHPGHGVRIQDHNPDQGPGIVFRPGKEPLFLAPSERWFRIMAEREGGPS